MRIMDIIMKTIDFVKQFFLDLFIEQEQSKPLPIIYIPKKPTLNMTIDTSNSRKWKGIVWHHSATRDDLVHKNIEGIIAYHKSFRIDFNSVALPQKEKLPGIEYVKYKNGEWYKKSEYNDYFAELKKKQNNPDDKRYFELAWVDVGYHGLIESANEKMIFGWGRPLTMIGAHAGYKEFNENYLGFCAIGNYDKNPVPDDVWKFALMVTRSFIDAFSIKTKDVIGHREVYDLIGVERQKQCPGSLWNMNNFRNEL